MRAKTTQQATKRSKTRNNEVNTMVTSIMYPNGESRLVILFDKHDDIENIRSIKRDLIGLLALVGGECKTGVNPYLENAMYLLELLEVGTDSFAMNKATRELLDKEAVKVSAFQNDSGFIANTED